MENNKSKIFNLLLIDESGSMSTLREQTISAFNEIVQGMQSLEKDLQGQSQFVSMYSFRNQDVKTLHDLAQIRSIEPLSKASYAPDGNTPLYDAIGKSVTLLEKQIHAAARIEGPSFKYQVLVTILTDGFENSSCVYSKAQIRSLIDRLAEGNWTFTYIGADHDVVMQSKDLGISDIYEFSKDEQGLKMMLEKEKMARIHFNQQIFENNEKPRTSFFRDEPQSGEQQPDSSVTNNTATRQEKTDFLRRIFGR